MNGVMVLFAEWVEAHFLDDRLINLVIKVGACGRKDALRLGKARGRLNRTSSLGTTIRCLHEAGIEWCVHQPLSDGKVVTLLTEGGATIEFVADSTRLLINRIHLSEGLAGTIGRSRASRSNSTRAPRRRSRAR